MQLFLQFLDAFQRVVVDRGVAEYPHQCRQPLHQLLHSWVFARVDGTPYPQRPHCDGVEAVGDALEDVDVQAFTCVNDFAALVHGEREEDILGLYVFSHQLQIKFRRELRILNDGRVSTVKMACQQFGRTG